MVWIYLANRWPFVKNATLPTTESRLKKSFCILRPPPVDLVFVNGVFHHIPPKDHGVNLDYIQSSLKPGGLLVIFENNPFNPGASWVMSRIPFDRDAVMVNPFHLLKQFRSRNFVGSFLNFFFIFPKILAGLRRIEKRFINLPIGAQYGLFTHKRHN